MKIKNVHDRWQELDNARHIHLEYAYEAAELTIPSVLHRYGETTRDLIQPLETIGTRGVTSLTSKILMAILPPDRKSFAIHINPDSLGPDDDISDLDQEFYVDLEERIQYRLDTSNVREVLSSAINHLIITGSCLVFVQSNYDIKQYRLDNYVISRSPDGRIMEVIARDFIDYNTLSESNKAKVKDAYPATSRNGMSFEDFTKKPIPVYTRAFRKELYNGGMEIDISSPASSWIYIQECGGATISQWTSRVPLFIAPRCIALSDGSVSANYGLSHVTNIIGTLRSLEAYAISFNEMCAIATRTIGLVDPSQPYTKPEELAAAENGDFVRGRPQDVAYLQMNKNNDAALAMQYVEMLRQQVSSHFLLNSSFQRDAERVTATEIRSQIQDHESVLGSLYALLASELQKPLIEACLYLMVKNKEVVDRTDEVASIKVITGYPAFEREKQALRMQELLMLAGQIPQVAQSIDWNQFIKKYSIAVGVDLDTVMKSEEAIMQERQQQLAEQTVANVAQKALPNMITPNQ